MKFVYLAYYTSMVKENELTCQEYKQQGLPKRSLKEDAQAKRGYVDVYKGLMCRKTKVFHQQSAAFNTQEES